MNAKIVHVHAKIVHVHAKIGHVHAKIGHVTGVAPPLHVNDLRVDVNDVRVHGVALHVHATGVPLLGVSDRVDAVVVRVHVSPHRVDAVVVHVHAFLHRVDAVVTPFTPLHHRVHAKVFPVHGIALRVHGVAVPVHATVLPVHGIALHVRGPPFASARSGGRLLPHTHPFHPVHMVSSASTRDYSLLDHPSILSTLFYPRPASSAAAPPGSSQDFLIPAADAGVVLGARLHLVGRSAPTILFFHGNGEIVEDYDDIASLYTDRGINLLVVDYRGYGRSTGRPSCSAMMRDCHPILAFVTSFRAEHGHDGPLITMGRSLGSASALEVAAHDPDRIAGLIIESGFASTMPRLRFHGIDPQRLSLEERDGFGNLDKIRSFQGPTLVIHGERDRIIDCAEGRALHEASPAERKRLLVIPGADHNNLLFVGMAEYTEAIGSFCAGLE